ncbi:DNA polymerase III subunit gamma and tau [Gulosibacter hominis]|uniref:DNA polymerase III subunit gamma and tau n=1 Tax=Gulosibacter hominis TaxID=2770504 RepID=UPI0019192E04|nr:DNA polymerase III subunit gamma and tau [Gulosibacter hominis]
MVAALYRRYRPENFAEMIGQQQVTEPLMTALRTGRINHAYLFSGPRGCGKTSSARILARCLNCAQGPTPMPCGECDSCRELGRDGGGSLDVIEIDAASHGGVDDARELRERAVTAPARDRYKIFIIDEAHMVTSQGFNALLKVVEEPPEQVLFIFATTEPEKVIGTIRSRTHHYPFRLIAPATMLAYLGEICEHENVAAESGVLPLVVRAGGGSARDTLSLLDQLIAGTEGSQMQYEMASQLLGFTASGLLDATITAFADGDAAEAYGAIDDVIQSGQDPRRFVEDLLERVRDLIVAKATGDSAGSVLRGVSDADLNRLRDSAARFQPAQLSAIADAVNVTLTEMVGVTAPRLQLELMVARILVALRARFADAEGDADVTLEPGAGSSGRVAAASREASKPAAAPQQHDDGAVPAAAAPQAESTQQSGSAQQGGTVQQSGPAQSPQPAPAQSSEPARKPAPAESAPKLNAAEQATSAWAAAATPTDTAPGETSPQQNRPTESSPQESTDGSTQPTASGSPADVDLRRVRDAWPDVLERVLETAGRSAWAVVERVEPVAWQGNSLRVEVPNRGLFEQFKRKDASGMAPGHHLKAALSQTFGFEVLIYPRVLADGAPRHDVPAGGSSADGRDDAEGDRSRQVAEGASPSPAPASKQPAKAPAQQAPETRPGAITWDVAEIPSGAAEDGPGSGWDGLAAADDGSAAEAPVAESGAETPAQNPVEPPAVPAGEPVAEAEQETGPVAEPEAEPATEASVEAGAEQTTEPAAEQTAEERIPEVIAAREAIEMERATEPQAPVIPPPASPTWEVAELGGETEPTPEPEPEVEPEPERHRHPAQADRYGESVVRELLSARFVGEEALPESSPFGAGSAAAPDGPSDADAPDDFEAPPEER